LAGLTVEMRGADGKMGTEEFRIRGGMIAPVQKAQGDEAAD
jgi:hypothetical protein